MDAKQLIGVKFGYELGYLSCPVEMAPHQGCNAFTNYIYMENCFGGKMLL